MSQFFHLLFALNEKKLFLQSDRINEFIELSLKNFVPLVRWQLDGSHYQLNKSQDDDE